MNFQNRHFFHPIQGDLWLILILLIGILTGTQEATIASPQTIAQAVSQDDWPDVTREQNVIPIIPEENSLPIFEPSTISIPETLPTNLLNETSEAKSIQADKADETNADETNEAKQPPALQWLRPFPSSPQGELAPESVQPNQRDSSLAWLSPSYTLTVGDRVGILFSNVPEYTADYQVQVDGTLHLPVVGPLSVWGLTLSEVEQLVAQTYERRQILRKPTVTLKLLINAPIHVAVIGEVVRPGAYLFSPQDTSVFPRITTALQQAGGITQQTNLQDITIYRWHRSGQHHEIHTNLWQLLETGDLNQDITLRDGDTLVLKKAPPVDATQAIALGKSNISQSKIQIGIVGELEKAGTFEVPPNTPLNQVLLAAGGFNNRAQKRTVELMRLRPNGTVFHLKIPVDFKAPVNEATNPMIEDRDIIIVPPSRLAKLSDRVDSVVQPLINTIGGANSLYNTIDGTFSIKDVFKLFRVLFR